jgi:cell division protein FtsW
MDSHRGLLPGELLNVSFSLVFASFYFRRPEGHIKTIWALRFAILAVPLLMLLGQPDFGTFAIIVTVGLALLFAYGLQWRYVLAGLSVAFPAFYFLVMSVPYRRARVLAFLDPWADPAHKGFQVIQSMLSYHAGGLTGAGLGQGQGKLFFLPEAHTDFTMSVVGEEMGFVGFAFILFLYGYIVFRGFQISIQSKNSFKGCVALGFCLTFALAIFVNVGMTMGILPTKGLALPFLSYGGSSLLNLCFLVGLLINLHQDNQSEKYREA